MTKRTKRFIAGLMAGVMVVAMAVPGFAGTQESQTFTKDFTISGNSETYTTKVKITVPDNITAVVNPYAAEIKDEKTISLLKGVGLDPESVSSTSILSPKYWIENESDIDVKVVVEDFKVSTNGIKLASSPVAAKSGAVKSAYVYMQFATADGEDFIGSTLKKPKEENGKLKMVTNDPDNKYKAALNAKNKIWELKAKEAKTGKKGSTLKVPTSIKSGEKAYIRIMGDVNASPVKKVDNKKVNDEWSESDKLNISYKLTFTGNPAYK